MSPILGKYEPIATLGRGGMADVFLAALRGPAQFSKLVVVKRLRSNLAEEPEFLAMFLDEARLAARLNHPNVVQTNEVGESDGKHYIVMEYLEGQALNKILQRATGESALPPAVYLTIVSQALAGLHHAHELRDFDGKPLHVVHRDISPHNIFVTYEGLTKLVDFGIAKAATRSNETRAGVLKGKVGYMSPEQAKGADVDRRSDVFSMGVVLWELVSGMRLWQDSDARIVELIGQEPIPPLRSKKPDAPEELDAICARALAIDPDERYSSAAEMRDAIEAYVEKELHRATERDIARRIAELFADERDRLRDLIEKRLSGLSTDGALEGLEDELEGTESLARPLSGKSDPSSFGSSRGTHAGATLPTVRVGARARQRSSVLVAGALALAAAAGGGLAVLVQGGRDKGEAPPTPVPADSRTIGKPNVIEIRVVASPPEAKLFLDDALLPENPYAGRFSPDGMTHRLRAEAPGLESQTRVVVFDRPQDVEMTLAPPTPPTPAPSSSPSAGPSKGKAGKGPGSSSGGAQPPLDPDPWAR